MAVVGAGGWLGFSFYAKHRVTAEVETAFEQIRKQGGKASYGKIAFDLPTRTLTIEDIAVTPGKAPQAQIRIAAIRARAFARSTKQGSRPTPSTSPGSRLRWTRSALPS
ncbi:hypothetical protein ACFKHW_18795 [Bradyrhizobium lupini]|uniref:hypothetical protein n=1 Tax=Rhizobium lupini TaxID=136996 RepID=UPI00366B3425